MRACPTVVAAVLWALTLAAAGCAPSGNQPNPSGQILAGRTQVGGLCSDGECRTELTVYGDGHWVIRDNGKEDRGDLSGQQVDLVRSGVDTTRLDAAPDFEGTCATASDGFEIIYTWVKDSVPHEVSTCKRVVSPTDPLVMALEDLSAHLR